jgi:transposase
LFIWAVRRGGVVFVASLEEVALEAGLSKAAARRGVRRLEQERWVRLRRRGDGRRASEWELIGIVAGTNGGRLGGAGEDWTRWGAVGKSGFYVWRCTIGGASLEEVAAAHGVSHKWARRMLQRLEAIGVVVHRDGRWEALEYDGIAERYGRAGSRELAKAHLEQQRELRRKRKPVVPARAGTTGFKMGEFE